MPAPTLTNTVPSGTLPGSPIVVVNVHADAGQGRQSISVPIHSNAQPGDYMVAFFGMGFQTSYTFTAPSFTGFAPSSDAGSADGLTNSWFATRVVGANDPGKAYVWTFTESLFTTWSLVVYTLRHVNLSAPANAVGPSSVGSNIGTGAFTQTGSVTPNVPNTLALGYIEAAANAFVAGVGIGPGPLPAWFTQATPSGSQPTAGMVSGILDMPASGLWGGAACQWNEGGTIISVSYAGWAVAFAPTPAPAAPTVTLAPAGGSIDVAGTSGTPFAVSWSYTPVGNQGGQEGWLIARQPNGGGTLQFWNSDSALWQATEYWNLGLATQFTFPTGAWVNDGTHWDLSVAIRESALHYKSAPTTVTFTADNPPSLSSVAITNPNTATPTVTWAESLTIGPQVAYRVRVFSSDQIALTGFNPANILVGDDSDFELSAGTWQSLNSLVAAATATNYTGGGDLKITANTTAGVSAFSGSYPVTPGVQYYASGYVRSDVTARSMHLGLSWQDITGNQISATAGTAVADSTSAWTQLTVNGTAPTGAVTARLTVASTVSAVNEVHRLDQAHWAATPVPRWTPGMVLSTALSAVTGSLAGGGTYTAYVQVLQTGDQLTPTLSLTNGTYVNVATASWYAGFSAPVQPTIAVVPRNDPATGAPTNFVTVTGHDVGPFAGTGAAWILYSDDQINWTTLRGASALPLTTGSGQVATMADFEVFQNTPRYYQAYVLNTSSTIAVTSVVSTLVSATAVSSPYNNWLVPPLNPSASTVVATTDITQTQMEQVAAHYPLGRNRPVVLFDVVDGQDGQMTVFTGTPQDYAALDVLVAQQATMWFSTPLGDGFYIRLGPPPGGFGSSTGATIRTTTFSQSTVKSTIIPYAVVTRPLGNAADAGTIVVDGGTSGLTGFIIYGGNALGI